MIEQGSDFRQIFGYFGPYYAQLESDMMRERVGGCSRWPGLVSKSGPQFFGLS